MPTYITLIRYTQKGIENIKEGPSRLDKAKAAVKEAGGEIQTFYLTLGAYDAVFIAEAPDDATYAKVTLAIASEGNVQTETLKAFTEDEFRQIVEGLP